MATIKMATKEQERKALEQIKQIIAGLGKVSYIGMAMEGMIEDAEENIENDFALSMKDRYEGEKKKVDLLADDLEAADKEIKRLKDQLACTNRNFDDLQDNHNRLMKEFDQMRIEKFEAENRAGCAESKIVELKDEIIRLKAKCFDLMEKQA